MATLHSFLGKVAENKQNVNILLKLYTNRCTYSFLITTEAQPARDNIAEMVKY